MRKGQFITVKKAFFAQGRQYNVGESFVLFMEGGPGAAHLFQRLTKAGKPMTVNNARNVAALHVRQLEEAIAKGNVAI